MKIKDVKARQMLDTKARPVVEVDVITEDGHLGRGTAPTGTSVGMYESFVLRDNEAEYKGLSVHKAVNNVQQYIRPAIIGKNIFDLNAIDQLMIDLDGTEDKHILGGNAIYSVSIACLRAAAACRGKEVYEYLAKDDVKQIPVPSFNVINGGSYNNFTQAFNEFIVIPYKANNIFEAVEISIDVFKTLKDVLTEFLGFSPSVANSYGYVAPSDDPEVVLSLMREAAERTGHKDEVAFGIDCASGEMYDVKSKKYELKGKKVTTEELLVYLENLTNKFPLLFIEDPFDENDWRGFELAHEKLTKTLIVGDDLIATKKSRLKKAITCKAIDGFVLKPNQVGTISEALETFEYASNYGVFALPSGRSGGIIGDIVMDFSVALNVGFIKNGAPRSGERIDKLNYLMRIADLNPEIKLANIQKWVKF